MLIDYKSAYSVDYRDELYCKVLTKLHRKETCLRKVSEKSRRKYGMKDNLYRYYLQKYEGVSVGRYSYGYSVIGVDFLKSVGAFTSVAVGCTSVH